MKFRRLWANLFRIALSVTALALLLREVGGADVVEVLRDADPGYLGSACLLFLLGIVIRLLRWRALLHWLCSLAVGIRVLLSFYFVFVPLLSLTLLIPTPSAAWGRATGWR
ncbi:MAG: hypothetical protein JXR84_25530 [Anaerolineae bacterium]|nr:hypothetical protein [Anaerolineae bacterium]